MAHDIETTPKLRLAAPPRNVSQSLKKSGAVLRPPRGFGVINIYVELGLDDNNWRANFVPVPGKPGKINHVDNPVAVDVRTIHAAHLPRGKDIIFGLAEKISAP